MADLASKLLTRRLHFLRNKAPQEFSAFQEALNAWAGAKLSLVTGIPPAQLEQFQGQMQAIELFLTFLKDSEVKPTD